MAAITTVLILFYWLGSYWSGCKKDDPRNLTKLHEHLVLVRAVSWIVFFQSRPLLKLVIEASFGPPLNN